jgi:hypothetical protein
MAAIPKQEHALEQAILSLLAQRGEGKTICPSEAARVVAASGPGHTAAREDWEPLMQPAREAALRLVAEGRLDIVQHGEPVDGHTAKGPLRLRLR